jgi:hypothetical protein
MFRLHITWVRMFLQGSTTLLGILRATPKLAIRKIAPLDTRCSLLLLADSGLPQTYPLDKQQEIRILRHTSSLADNRT